MKKYKTWEVIKMLTENPELKFEWTKQVMPGSYIQVENGIVVWSGRNQQGNSMYTCLDDEWALVQQPVTFIQAIKAYAEGKTIRCEYISPDKHNIENIYKPSGMKISCLKDENCKMAVSDYEILNGTWYIEGDNQ